MAIPTGEIYLLNNVPLNPSYEHTFDFKDANEQFDYFRTFIKFSLSEYTYTRREREFIAVELPMTALEDINYIIFRSQEGERLYYGFVTDKHYSNGESSYIYFQIDVMQTYQFEYEWRETYIKQSHVDRWTAEHKPIYSKTDEGLDYGTDYSVENAYRIEQSRNLKWLLVSMTDYSEAVAEGAVYTINGLYPAPSPFMCFLVPVVMTDNMDSRHSVRFHDDVGATHFIADYADLISVLQNSAVGNYVKAISILSYNPFVATESQDLIGGYDVSFFDDCMTFFTKFKGVDTSSFLGIKSALAERLLGGNLLATADWDIGLENTLPTPEEWAEVKNKPFTTKRDKRFESKLLTSPYRYNILTDWRNNPVIYKNEYLPTDRINIQYSFAMSHNAPFRFWLKDYKKDPEGRYNSLLQPIALEMPILTDAYYTYMLENKNTIQANLTNSIISAGSGVVSGAVSGASAGGVFGAIAGAVGGATSGALNVATVIRNENAKQADLKAKPDSVINSVDSSFNLLDRNTDVTFYRMRICCENEDIIAQIFAMTGYKVNRVDIPNTRSRTRFNYIQTAGANIVGSFNQSDLMRIKEIYDKGVTIWHYNKTNFSPYDYSYENIEVNLV